MVELILDVCCDVEIICGEVDVNWNVIFVEVYGVDVEFF